VETNTQSAAAEKKPSDTHDSEMRSLLAVKQDFSRLDFSDNSMELSEKSCSQVSLEGDGAAETESAAADDDDITVDEAQSVEPVELNVDHDVHCEQFDDKLQPHKSCGLPSNHLNQSQVAPDESHGSPSSHADGDEFCDTSSNHDETAVESDQFSDAKSKKAPLKRKPAEHTSCIDDSKVVKKLRHKTCAPEVSASQLVRTTSGTFVVRDITKPGELLQIVLSCHLSNCSCV